MNHCDVARKITGLMAAPAVRIGMLEVRAIPQAAALGERRFDHRIRVEHLHAAHDPDIGREPAIDADWRVDLEPVPDARREVVGTMTGALCAPHRCPDPT
jgi:hypothetical protein